MEDKMSKKLKKLHIDCQTYYTKYQTKCERLALELQKYCDFELYVIYQPSDGFVVGYDQKLCPVSTFIRLIDRDGKVEFEDFLRYCI